MATDVARLALQIDVKGASRAKAALAGLQTGSIKATRATDQLVAANSRLNSTAGASRSAFRLQKGAIQQAGFQIQDFAVQVGAGQSALVAFSQQGSQLAGILGPGGAVIGAVIAVGAAIAGPFIARMGMGTDAVTLLTETLDEVDESLERAENGTLALTERIREMAQVSQAAARIELSAQLVKIDNALKGVGSSLRDTFGENGDFSDAISIFDQLARSGQTTGAVMTAFESGLQGVEPGLLDDYRFLANSLTGLRDEFGLTRNQSLLFLDALKGIQDEPTADNLNLLVGRLNAIQTSSEATTPQFALMASEVSNVAVKALRLIEQGESLDGVLGDLQSALTVTSDEAETAAEQIEKMVAAAEHQAATIGLSARAVATYEAALAGANAEQILAIDKALRQVEAQDELERANRESEKQVAKYEKALSSLKDELDPVGKAFDDFAEKSALLDQALEAGDISPEKFRKFKVALVEGFAEAGEEGGKKGAESYETEFSRASERVAGSLQDAITSGDWAGVGDTVGASIASGVASAVSTQLAESVTGELGAFLGPIGGALAGGLVGALLQSSDRIDPTAQRQSSQGTGTVFGDLISKTESIANSSQMTADATEQLVGINRDLANALTRTTAGAGEVAGIAGGFASGAGLNAIIADAGFQFVGSLADASAAAFAESGAVSGGFRARFEFQNSELTTAVQQTFNAISDSVTEGAQALGIDASDAINRYVIDLTRVSLEGLSAEESKAEIQRVFGVIFDEIAEDAVPFLTDLQKLGEGLGETLARVATSVQSVDAAAEKLNVAFGGDAGAAAGIIEAAGGVNEFISAISRFERSFLSDSEQMENATRDLSTGLGRINAQIPDTRQGFADLLREQLSANNQNQEAVATLLRLQGVADQYYTNIEQGAEEAARAAEELLRALEGNTDAAFQALQRSVAEERDRATDAYSAEQDAIRAATDARLDANRMAVDAAKAGLSAIQSEVRGIESALDQLRGAFDPMQQMRRQSAVALLRNALATGDLAGTGEAAGIAAQIEGAGFATRADFEREQGRTLNLLTDLDEVGGIQLTTAEQSLAALEAQTRTIKVSGDAQLDALKQAHQEEMARLDRTLENAQSQINLLRGIDNSVLSVADAINNLAGALGQETTSRVEGAFEAVGRTADEQGANYWESQIKKGAASIADLEFALWLENEGAREFARAQGLSLANGGIASGPTSGYMAELHGNEAVIPLSGGAVPVRMSGGGDGQMAAEIRKLREDLNRVGLAIAKNTGKTSKQLERWEFDGLPEERVI